MSSNRTDDARTFYLDPTETLAHARATNNAIAIAFRAAYIAALLKNDTAARRVLDPIFYASLDYWLPKDASHATE